MIESEKQKAVKYLSHKYYILFRNLQKIVGFLYFFFFKNSVVLLLSESVDTKTSF